MQIKIRFGFYSGTSMPSHRWWTHFPTPRTRVVDRKKFFRFSFWLSNEEKLFPDFLISSRADSGPPKNHFYATKAKSKNFFLTNYSWTTLDKRCFPLKENTKYKIIKILNFIYCQSRKIPSSLFFKNEFNRRSHLLNVQKKKKKSYLPFIILKIKPTRFISPRKKNPRTKTNLLP